MNEMVERVARAIAVEMAGDWDRIPERSAGETSREDLRVAARLAIKAMREPTKEMAETGVDAYDFGSAENLIERRGLTEAWRAMIDAALGEVAE